MSKETRFGNQRLTVTFQLAPMCPNKLLGSPGGKPLQMTNHAILTYQDPVINAYIAQEAVSETVMIVLNRSPSTSLAP